MFLPLPTFLTHDAAETENHMFDARTSKIHQWQRFGENASTHCTDIADT